MRQTCCGSIPQREDRRQNEDDDFGRTGNGNLHRSDGAVLGAGVHAMKVNRRTQPIVYTRMSFTRKNEIERLREEQRKALRDVLLLAYAFGFLVFLFMVVR